MTEFEQTWWNKNLPNRLEEFNSWVGDANATSKVFCRKLVKDGGYSTLVDFGCGTATEYFGYKQEYQTLTYFGIDSCEALVQRNLELGIPTVNEQIENTSLLDNSYEVVFARHVLEHQPTSEPTLKEMIRVASKLAMHVFFMKPRREPESIGYTLSENLYHNRYDTEKIENFLRSLPKVKSFKWVDIDKTETVLLIYV